MRSKVRGDQSGQAASAISMTGRKKYSSDVNIWLVSDLGIITSDQPCQFFMQNAVKSSKLPNSSKLDEDGSISDGESECFVHMCIEKSSSDKKYRH